MAQPYKNNKLFKNTLEFDKVGTKYNINGIDLGDAVFFWRRPQEMFKPIPKGAYKVLQDNNNQILEIIDTDELQHIERFQINYAFATISSEYIVDFGADVNILKDRYNELVKDVKNVYDYMKSNMMVGDGQDMTLVMPTLEDGEVWVKTDDGWKGFQVGQLETQIQALLVKIQEATTNALKDIEDNKNNALLGITNSGDAQNTRIVNQGDTQSNRLNSIDSQVSTKLDLMQRMMAVTVGANRWLDGGFITSRNTANLERTADGGDITQRTGLPRRIYDAGDITKRVIDVPIHIDLGEVN